MALQPGNRLGPYEILAAIGAGGMGEVYRARDAKLGRDVALKVLPEAFARDTERLARFQREAKALASLNHPNICTIYEVDEANGRHFIARVPPESSIADGTDYLGMECVEGETLAKRLSHSF